MSSPLDNFNPGVQIQLLVKPEQIKKRFFETIVKEQPEVNTNTRENYSALLLEGFVYNLIESIQFPNPNLSIICERKQEIINVNAISIKHSAVFLFALISQFASFISKPINIIAILEKNKIENFIYCFHVVEERIPYLSIDVVTRFIKKNQRHRYNIVQGKFDKNNFPPPGYRSYPFSIEHDNNNISSSSYISLKESLINKMNIQKLKDLDTETKLLKVLMREINKNQIELSKMLVEKKVYSQSIIKLLDPNVLEEENKTVKKITEMEVAKKNTSAKSLQVKKNSFYTLIAEENEREINYLLITVKS